MRHAKHCRSERAYGSPEGGFKRHRQNFRGGGRGGPRARRGDVRAAILALLDEGPMHGYEMINQLSEKTGGLWSPSPGSIYPTLQLLEETGLIEGTEEDGKRRYSITDEGRKAVTEREGALPWEKFNTDANSGHAQLFHTARQLAAAVQQAAMAGTDDQRTRVREILEDARRKVYAILAEETPAEDAGTGRSS